MSHPVSSFQSKQFLYPRTANDSYGIFAVKEVQRQNDTIRKHLIDTYNSNDKRQGVTTNAEYGSYMHVTADEDHPLRQNWHIDYPDCPEDSPRESPRKPIIPPIVNKPHSECHENITLPPISYRNNEEKAEPSPPRSPRKESHQVPYEFRYTPRPLPPTKDFYDQFTPRKTMPPARMIPSPPLPPTERFYEQASCHNTPRTYHRMYPQPPLPPLPGESDLPQRQYGRNQSPENTPRLFPRMYSQQPPPPPEGPPRRPFNADIIHLGAAHLPFSDVEAVELHLKDRSSIMMNVDELKKRYVS